MHPRDLTFQEKKAAEAAFQGHPLEPGWSEKARAIYDGITKARGGPITPALPVSPIEVPPEPVDQPASEGAALTQDDRQAVPPIPGSPGYFVDLSPMAHGIGLTSPVVISKPLWDAVVNGPGQPGLAPADRLRTLLRAVQQALSVTPGSVAGIALRTALAGPPDDGPRTVEIRVVTHAHPSDQTVTLLRLDEPWRALPPEAGTPAN
jgi:hypothetical protein